MKNSIGILGYDYVEFYVGSAKMTAYWFMRAFGMKLSGYSGPESGTRDRVSYYLTQNNLKFVVTAPLKPESYEISGFVVQHGEGVKRWALRVKDVDDAFLQAVSHGAIPVQTPTHIEDESGYITEASIRIYDDTELVLLNNDHYSGVFKPGYIAPHFSGNIQSDEPQLQKIDHIVGNVRTNEMNQWVNYFNNSLDFETFIHFGPGDISTKYSALLSTVVHSKDNLIKNPINEPYEGIKVSQIEEYIREYKGSGIQHVAIATDDILSSIRALRNNGVDFLEIPESYYDQLEERNAGYPKENRITEDLSQIRESGILCDIESTGYLLQLFTKPFGDRPTFFFEIIQRKNGAEGFGQGNFQALFESIEGEQAKRGNLDR